MKIQKWKEYVEGISLFKLVMLDVNLLLGFIPEKTEL